MTMEGRTNKRKKTQRGHNNGGDGGNNKRKKQRNLGRRDEHDTAGDDNGHDNNGATDSHSNTRKKTTVSTPKIEDVLMILSSEEKCDLIAELSEMILEDPTKAFQSEKLRTTNAAAKSAKKSSSINNTSTTSTVTIVPSKMQQLLDLSRTHKNGHDEHVATLAIMSLLAIFKDILPSYRIRQQTDLELQGNKISKETKALWDYERALLAHYQQYLQVLEKAWDRDQQQSKGGKNKKKKDESQQHQSSSSSPSRLAITAMLSLCELFKSAYHFNFRSNILTIVVRQMNNRSCDQVSQACCEAVGYVFENDSQGEVAMETARRVAKLIKDYKGVLRPNVVQTFIKLPLRVHVDEAQAAKLATAANAKKRKKDKELAEIESELKESSGTVDKLLLARCQSETLQSVILTYFRILKSSETDPKKELLPVALAGLAKFAHLINIDTVVDLLDLLKRLLLQVDSLSLEASLNCVLTAFQALQGPGREMQIDQKEYITPLYSQLTKLVTEESCRNNTPIMMQCLTLAFVKRKEYSTVRVASFLKQMFTVAMHAPAYTSVPILALARQILQRYPAAHSLLESESDVITSGQYTPDVVDPEHSNPFSTAAWELSCLKFHIDPDVRKQAESASVLKMLQMPSESPDRMWTEKIDDADICYIPFQRMMKRHPLTTKNDKTSSKSTSNTKAQIRFITPRKSTVTLITVD
jgi:nucleolar complex protein 3